ICDHLPASPICRFRAVLALWLTNCYPTRFSHEQTGKAILAPIRRRFVPAWFGVFIGPDFALLSRLNDNVPRSVRSPKVRNPGDGIAFSVHDCVPMVNDANRRYILWRTNPENC